MKDKSVLQVWGLVNSIRGMFVVTDYPYIVLPTLLLKWAELKNREEGFAAYKEIYSPSRLAATYGSTDGAKDVLQYLLDIEKCQDKVLGGYISEVFTHLDMIPAKDFSKILGAVSQIEVDRSEVLYDMARALLQQGSRAFGNKTSQIISSASGVKTIEKIALGQINEKDTLFDGFAGTGVSAIEASDGVGTLILADKNPNMACISEMLCILRECKAEIYVQDSFLSSHRYTSYDKVLIEPPFGVKGKEYKDEELPYFEMDVDLMSLKYALNKINSDGVAVVLSPASVLFRNVKSAADTRKALVSDNSIDMVIQLPVGAVTGTAVSTAVLVLKKNKKDDKILFVDASKLLERTDDRKTDMILSAESGELLKSIIDNRKVVEEVSNLVPAKEVADHDYSLVLAQYVNKPLEKREKVDIKALLDKNSQLEIEVSAIDEEFKKNLANRLQAYSRKLTEIQNSGNKSVK